MTIIPTFAYFRDGYWFAVVSNGHSLAGTKAMAKTKRAARRYLCEALGAFKDQETAGPDGAMHLARLQNIARMVVSEFGASAA